MNGFTKPILSIVLNPSEFFYGFEDVRRIIIVYDVEKHKVLPKQSLFSKTVYTAMKPALHETKKKSAARLRSANESGLTAFSQIFSKQNRQISW